MPQIRELKSYRMGEVKQAVARSLVPRRYAGTPARHFYDVLAVANAPEPSLKLGDACGEGGGNRVAVFEPSLREFEAGDDRPA